MSTKTIECAMNEMSSNNSSAQANRQDVPLSEIRKTRRSFVAALIVLFVVSLAVYVNTLQNGFVYDDAWQVLQNNWIRDIRSIPDIMGSNVWGFSAERSTSDYYRPMMHLIYMLVYHVFGLHAWAFHLLNILLNALVCMLVFLTTAKLLERYRPSSKNIVIPAAAAAALFTTHPVHTEAVAWIAAVPELSYSFFCLLSFYLYVRAGEGARTAFPLSVAAFFLATFCKEQALLFPIALVASDYCLEKRTDIIGYLRRYAPYLAAAGIYLAARTHALGGLSQIEQHTRVDAYSYIINIFPLFTAYLAKLVLPLNLNAYIVFHPVSTALTIKEGAAVIVTLAFLVLLILSYRGKKMLFLGLVLILAPLAPSFYIPSFGENVFAERYLYLPSFGFVLLIAVAIHQISGNYDLAKRAGIVVIIVAGLYAIGTINRNTVWRDDLSLYADIVKKSPDAALMHINLGWTYYGMGRSDDALREYAVALDLKPRLAEAHNNIGLVFEQRGRMDVAIQEYRTALDLKPDYPAAHNNLGNAYMRAGLVDNAITEFQNAVRLSPRFTAAHYNLGNAYASRGLFNEAVREYWSALELDPDEVDARNNLGVAYLNLNRMAEARKEFETALRIDPGYLPARQNIQRALQQRTH